MKKRLLFSTMPFAAVCLLALTACSEETGSDDANVIQAMDKTGSERTQNGEKDQAKGVDSLIKGGQELKMDQFTLVIPGDWIKNHHTEVLCPATEANMTPLPDHYLHQGARNPMMLNSSDLVEGITTHIGTAPQNIKMLTIGAMNGATCGWEKGKHLYIGLFLQEKIPGFDIPMLNFFVLRAPKETFAQHEKTYWAILNSVSI